MATARRAIFSSYVIPKESAVLEEGVTKWSIDKAIDKTLGGKGIATLTASQWGESWSSFQHPEQYWEDYGSNWDDAGEVYNNVGISITGAYSLNTDSDVNSTAVVFLYLKNLGRSSTQGLKLSLDGSNYKIYIPPQGSIHLRGDGSTLQLQHVKVNKVTDNTTIEYILAK